MTASELTIKDAQKHQPWTVPYSTGVMVARDNGVPHILASHVILHAAKSVGKLASIFEDLDHGTPVIDMQERIAEMSADLVTAALRLANLYEFDLATWLVERVEEKNGVRLLDVVGTEG